MADVAIRAVGLGKQYAIGTARRYRTLRESLVETASAPFRFLRREVGDATSSGRFWALRDISFEAQRGEAVGIIGRNGAGKSTLLKLLSRITAPSEGAVELIGRVGSLLEVGTGFHPELSGRENIYLNGAILGMNRAEIKRSFDAIVDFSEVEKFLETPVKRYSSGMYMRLAFAVAAHLEPEILVVDEVLAVGDVAFQKKCMGKMEDVASKGRTILFVSHNLGAIRSLCRKAVLLSEGRLQCVDATEPVIARYLRDTTSAAETGLENAAYSGDADRLRFVSARVFGAEGRAAASLEPGEPLIIELILRPLNVRGPFRIGVSVTSLENVRVFTVHHEIDPGGEATPLTVRARISSRLRPGAYLVDVGAHATNGAWWCAVPKAVRFDVENIINDPYNMGLVSADAHWAVSSGRGNG